MGGRMKRILAIGIILLFIGSISTSTGFDVREQSNTTFNGKTLYVGGSGPGNYTTIQDAIDNASDGDRVFVYHGTYYENIVINTSINLVGENKNITVIDGNWGDYSIYVNADLINISRFTIQRSGCSGINIVSSYNTITNNIIINNWCSSIDLDYSNCNIITNNILSNSTTGLYLFKSNKNIITENNISFNDFGIELNDSSNNIIACNSIFSNRDGAGIHLRYSKNNSITCNTISNNQDGICFYESSNNTIKDNNIISNEYDGIRLIFFSNDVIITRNNISNNGYNGIYLFYSSNHTINGNNISNNSAHGIELRYSNNIIITDNNIRLNYFYGVSIFTSSDNNTLVYNHITSNNWGGIGIRFSSRNNITGNNITSNNGKGIRLNFSNHNLIYHNYLINNNPNAYDDCSNIWDNGYPSGGNYWDDCYGLDYFSGPNQNMSGSDGICDNPYNISGGMNQDRYPLGSFSFDMEPPQIDIIKPVKGGIYIFNQQLCPFLTTVIIGKIDIIINATDNQSGINRIELYIDNELKAISNNSTLYWTWENRKLFGYFRHTIKTVAYDNAGNNATIEMKVWKFL